MQVAAPAFDRATVPESVLAFPSTGHVMALYFFDRTDGIRDIDVDGTELPTIAEARIQAVILLGETLRDDPKKIWVGGELRVDVRDAQQNLVFTLVTTAASPRA